MQARDVRRPGHTEPMRIDLHTHSTVSDGTESPAEVVRAAHAAALDVVALTDHDSLDGLAQASAEADRIGIGFVPGIEMSARQRVFPDPDDPRGISVHIVGLWPDPADSGLQAMLARVRDARLERAQRIVALLAEDFAITWEDVAARAGGADAVGRPHVADALVDLGIVATRDEAFASLLRGGTKYFVPHFAPEVLDAVAMLRAAGAVPVFAHPGADARGHIVPTSVIESMAEAGLVGLEVDHRDHDERQRARLTRIADRLSLVRTGSSDYHGTGKLNRLGENLTAPDAFEALRAARG